MKYKMIFKMLIACGYEDREAHELISDAKHGCVLALHWIKGVRAVLKVKKLALANTFVDMRPGADLAKYQG